MGFEVLTAVGIMVESVNILLRVATGFGVCNPLHEISRRVTLAWPVICQ
jgi:hypothetical protein